MIGDDSIDRERVNRLMMAALDGEIESEEWRELNGILERDPAIRQEWERMNRVKEVTGAMAYRNPPEEVWGRYWTSIYNRLERGVGWILVSIGAMILIAYGAWEAMRSMWADAEMPLFLKVAVMAVVLGLIVLLISTCREKFFAWKRDPYKEIER
jgi:ferric-dicitrate binding protein FerR (iron transport regulator)